MGGEKTTQLRNIKNCVGGIFARRASADLQKYSRHGMSRGYRIGNYSAHRVERRPVQWKRIQLCTFFCNERFPQPTLCR
ncbi:hypothetical protein Poly21_01010 [Allorhodopirellula heiligendammensis]|uniref:Uncharacterized protein n=1 Tax=Allorhodopirellula heiligendammensis TaxID=2714739 RepID=A0A5C6C574_9BACT|nr:hypothetical protein Poly21_01010 [Allorhodopirellula heiligendammensis]